MSAAATPPPARRRSASDALASAVERRDAHALVLASTQAVAADLDGDLALAVRRWGKQTYGSVSALAGAVAAHAGLDDEYVRRELYEAGRAVLDHALALWREQGAQPTAAAGGSPAPSATSR